MTIAIAKITKNGKQVQFITDEGYVFGTSTVFMQGLMMGKSKAGFVLLSRMPFNIAVDRFKDSPLYDPQGIFDTPEKRRTLDGNNNLTTTNDAFSIKDRNSKASKKAFKDKKIW